MSIKQIDGKVVLSYLNLTTGDMEVRVADHPTGLGTAPVTSVVKPAPWPDPPEDPSATRRQPVVAGVRRLHLTGIDA